jgi:DNA-binding NarL/FixJ family response regulator
VLGPLQVTPTFLGFLGGSLRESDILRLIAGGLANKEIGAKLHLSEKTIKN